MALNLFLRNIVISYNYLYIYFNSINCMLFYCIKRVHVVLLGEGRTISACPVSVPHSPGEGVYRAGSRPRGRTDRPGGLLRGGWRGAPSTAGAERLYSLLT